MRYRTRYAMRKVCSQLPCEILISILSRLPIKTIIRFKCVSKTWKDMLSDPYFAKLHLDMAMAQPSLLFICVGRDSTPKPRSISICNIIPSFKGGGHKAVESNIKFELPKYHVQIAGSCNGLLCLKGSSSIYICNPTLGEYITLPKPKDVKKHYDEQVCSLGFSSKTNQYKVLRVVEKQSVQSSLCSYGMVYTLGTDMWRSIGDVPLPFYEELGDAYLNGALHWTVADPEDISEYICCFDLETEKCGSIPPPPLLEEMSIYSRLGVLGGSLCLSNYTGSQTDIWVMKNYGLKESWCKAFELKTSSLLQPLNIQEDESLLIKVAYDGLKVYNRRSKSFSFVKVDQLTRFNVVLHVPSFVSPKSFKSSWGPRRSK